MMLNEKEVFKVPSAKLAWFLAEDPVQVLENYYNE